MSSVDVQWVSASSSLPQEEQLIAWAEAVLSDSQQQVTLRIVDKEEMTQLNERYRKKQGATNVLSFPAELPPGIDEPILGDVVICAPVVEEEARDLPSLQAHWAHMVVHGILHLRGYDHIHDDEAKVMEAEEVHLLQKLGFEDPYER